MVRKYLSYKDDNSEETIVKGYFEVIRETDNFIEIKSNHGKIIKIPYHRILKIKGDAQWKGLQLFLLLDYF